MSANIARGCVYKCLLYASNARRATRDAFQASLRRSVVGWLLSTQPARGAESCVSRASPKTSRMPTMFTRTSSMGGGRGVVWIAVCCGTPRVTHASLGSGTGHASSRLGPRHVHVDGRRAGERQPQRSTVEVFFEPKDASRRRDASASPARVAKLPLTSTPRRHFRARRASPPPRRFPARDRAPLFRRQLASHVAAPVRFAQEHPLGLRSSKRSSSL